MPNGEIFQKASREQRIVLTFDLDFGEIFAASSGQVVRLRNRRSDFVIQRLDDVLKHSSSDLSQGAIVVVEDSRHRVRMLPIGS